MTPEGTVPLGTHVVLSGTSNCGTVRFTVNGEPRAEIGSSNQTETLRTEEFGTGGYEVCFVARGTGGWENAARTCKSLYIQGSQGAPPNSNPGTNVRCWVNQFTVTPSTIPFGGTAQFAGYGQCDGNARAARFYIDSQPWGEFGGNTTSASWSTVGYGSGSHQICFGITAGEWSQEARSCTSVTIAAPQVTPTPAVAQGSQTDNGQPGQTGQSGSGGVYNPTAVPQQNPPSQSSSISSSSGGSISPPVSQAQQRSTNGGVDLIVYCYARGYTGAGNSDNSENGWYCSRGNESWRVDWNQVCRDVYGSNYTALFTGGMNGIRCRVGGSSSGSGGSSNSGDSSGPNPPSVGGTSGQYPLVGYQSQPSGDYVCVVTGLLNIRNSPGATASIIARAPRDACFNYLGSDSATGWYNVSWGSGSGWVANGSSYTRRGSGSSSSVTISSGNSSSSASSNQGGGSQNACDRGALVSIGDRATVTPGVANRLRPRPGLNSEPIGRIQPGEEFTIVGGPECVDGYLWWQVDFQGTVGWTAQGDSQSNWIRWIATNPSSQREDASLNGQCIASARIRFINNQETVVQHDWQLRVFLNSPHSLDNGFRVYYRGQDVTDEIGDLDSAGVPGDDYADFWVSSLWAISHNILDINNRSQYLWSVVYNC